MTAPSPFYSPWQVRQSHQPPMCAASKFSSEARPVGCDLSLAARETEESAAPHSSSFAPPATASKPEAVPPPSVSGAPLTRSAPLTGTTAVRVDQVPKPGGAKMDEGDISPGRAAPAASQDANSGQAVTHCHGIAEQHTALAAEQASQKVRP